MIWNPFRDKKPAPAHVAPSGRTWFQETVLEARQDDEHWAGENRGQKEQRIADIALIQSLWLQLLTMIERELAAANQFMSDNQMAVEYYSIDSKNPDEDDLATRTLVVDGEATERLVECPANVDDRFRLTFHKIGHKPHLLHEPKVPFNYDIRTFSEDDLEEVLVRMFQISRGERPYV